MKCKSKCGCDRPVRSKGFCAAHYQRFLAGRDVNAPIKKRARLPKRPPGEWGPWILNPYGYVVRRRTIDGKQMVQFQHRMIIEDELGRPLTSEETVHHINGVKDDNRRENLELWASNQPKGQRVSDLLEWARSIIDRYEVG